MKAKPQLVHLKAKTNCPDCHGRGWLLVLRPDLVSKYKEIRPCHCVKALVEHRPDSQKVADQYIVLR